MAPADDGAPAPARDERSADVTAEFGPLPLRVRRLRSQELSVPATPADRQNATIALEEKRRLVALRFLKYRPLAPDEPVVTLEHERSPLYPLALRADREAELPTATEIRLPAVLRRPPHVVPERPLQDLGLRPLPAILRPHRIPQVQVQVEVGAAPSRSFAAVPGPRVNKELPLKDEKVRVSRVPLRHREPVHLLPLVSILAREHDHRGIRAHPVAVRTPPKRQIKPPSERHKIRERIVLAIVIDLPDIANGHGGGVGEGDSPPEKEHGQGAGCQDSHTRSVISPAGRCPTVSFSAG